MSTPGATENCEQLQESLIETTLEAFRLQRTFRQVLANLEPSESQKFTGRVNYFLSRIERNLEDAGMSIGDIQEGDRYELGMPVTALNVDDFDTDVDELVVDQTLEPVILNGDGVQRVGTVLLRKDT